MRACRHLLQQSRPRFRHCANSLLKTQHVQDLHAGKKNICHSNGENRSGTLLHTTAVTLWIGEPTQKQRQSVVTSANEDGADCACSNG